MARIRWDGHFLAPGSVDNTFTKIMGIVCQDETKVHITQLLKSILKPLLWKVDENACLEIAITMLFIIRNDINRKIQSRNP